MKKQNLRSEAAIKRWLDLPLLERNIYCDCRTRPTIIELRSWCPNKSCFFAVAEIDLKALIKKRKPLTGVKKQMAEIVSGKKKVKK